MLDDQKTGAGAPREAEAQGAPDSAPAWWRGASIYQIYPRSFADSDGDGTGDLPGIIAHLDHVASLGVDAIWVSPFFRSPMADFCLLYTSPSPRDLSTSRMPSSA